MLLSREGVCGFFSNMLWISVGFLFESWFALLSPMIWSFFIYCRPSLVHSLCF